MAKERVGVGGTPPEQVISIIGPGMRITGDCDTDGAVRIEGTVQGNVRAGKAVVVGKEGVVEGDIFTQDAVISGRVKGSVSAESRLEVQASSRLEGEIAAGRMQAEEGSTLTGTVKIGKGAVDPPSKAPQPQARDTSGSEKGIG
jgi:cytoskeletal protein CcmA (bactofilin family)